MGQRFVQLDGLRGVAAFSVFCYHALAFAPEESVFAVLRSSSWAMLWDGAAAVDLFFVLSGFVLAYPYLEAGTTPAYVNYVVRRVFRIFPAFLVAVLLSVALRMAHDPAGLELLSDWASVQWTEPMTPSVLLRTVSLFFLADVRPTNPVFWSLVVEIRMSLLIPFLVLALQKGRALWTDAGLLALSLAVGGSWSWLEFLPLFTLGALSAKHLASCLTLLGRLSRWGLCLLTVCGVCLYGHRALAPDLVAQQGHMVTAVGAVVLIFCVIRSAVLTEILCSPPLRFMGQVSYGFYLLHLPLLLLLLSWAAGSGAAMLLCVLLAMSLGYLLAWVIHHTVEKPGNHLGRALGARWT